MEKYSAPLISVIIPAYNAEGTIERACNSILTQPYSNVEVIIVNDGSKDGTAQLIDVLAVKDKRIHCIHQKNQGVCKARNVGMDYARGEYLFFLDADDALTENCLTKLISVAFREDADVVTGSFVHIETDGSINNVYFPMDDDCCIWNDKDAVKFALKDHPATHSACAKLYRRDLIQPLRFVEGKHIHEDSFFVFEVCMRFPKMVVLNELVVRRYMKKTGSINRKWTDSFMDILYFAKRKYSIVEQELPEFAPLASNIMVKASLALINSIRLIDDPRASAAEKECTAIVRRNAKYFVPAVKRDWVRFLFVYFGIQRIYKLIYRTQIKVMSKKN